METNQTYRPAVIEFDLTNPMPTTIPDTLGMFDNEKDVVNFLNKYTNAMPVKISVYRYMDNREKADLRTEYQDILENKIPTLNREHQRAKAAFDEAKSKFDNIKEQLSASRTEAEAIALDVKRGTKEIHLDEMNTFRIAFDDRYFFYTWIDKQLKLCRVSDIPEHEKQELFNAQQKNQEFFTHPQIKEILSENILPKNNEPAATQERKKK